MLEVVGSSDGTIEGRRDGGLFYPSVFSMYKGSQELVLRSYLSLLSREVVGALQGTGDTLANGSITTVIGRKDGVLETTGVQEVDVELAVLAGLGNSNTGADGGNVGVEDEGHDAPVGRDLRANSTLRAAGSSVGHTTDLDLFDNQNPGITKHWKLDHVPDQDPGHHPGWESRWGRQPPRGGEREATSS